MTPKIGVHPMSPSLQHYKIHLINYSIEVPTAPPSYTKSQLHPESCFHLGLYEPRTSYPQKPWGLTPGTLYHQKYTRRAGDGPCFMLLTVREQMSEPKSRCPVTYRYQNPQGHFIPCLLLELLCSTGCLEARTHQGHAGHCWLQWSRLLPQQLGGGRCLSLVGTRTVAGGCWEPRDKPRSRGIRKSPSCSAVAQSQPSPLPRD